MPKYVTINGERLRLEKKHYGTGHLALEAFGSDGLPFGTISVNIPELNVPTNQIFFDINNLGPEVLNQMQEQGVLRFTGQGGQSGFVTYPLCELLI
jgi:hypothetical protein